MTVRIIIGCALEELRKLPTGSVHCVATSPPYWGLRDFKVKATKWADGWMGAYGLEPTYQQYIEHTLELFREIWRVLRDDGVLWLNMGDCYANSSAGWSAQRYKDEERDDRTFRDKPFNTFAAKRKPGGTAMTDNGRSVDWGYRNRGLDGSKTAGQRQAQPGLKQKDKCMMPARVAIALQEDGWYLRQDVIWHKKNPMPESIFDRPVTAHEYLFLFTKSGDTLCWHHQDGRWVYEKPEPDYRWRHRVTRDVTALEQKTGRRSKWFRFNLWRGFDYYYDADAIKEPVGADTHARIAHAAMRKGGPVPAGWDEGDGRHGSVHRDGRRQKAAVDRAGNRLKQNVSFLNAVGISGVVETRHKRSVWSIASAPYKGAHFATFPPKLIEPCILAGCPPGGTVLDPFFGAGTTGLVAQQLGRNCIGIEVNKKYAAMADARIKAAFMGPEQKKRHAIKSSGKLKPPKGLPLFTPKKAVTRDRAITEAAE